MQVEISGPATAMLRQFVGANQAEECLDSMVLKALFHWHTGRRDVAPGHILFGEFEAIRPYDTESHLYVRALRRCHDLDSSSLERFHHAVLTENRENGRRRRMIISPSEDELFDLARQDKRYARIGNYYLALGMSSYEYDFWLDIFRRANGLGAADLIVLWPRRLFRAIQLPLQ